jgi:hypothetical protein
LLVTEDTLHWFLVVFFIVAVVVVLGVAAAMGVDLEEMASTN